MKECSESHPLKDQLALDNPNLVGIGLHEASDFDRTNHEGQYFAPPKGQQGL
jgi:hypothetical protein